MNGILACKIHIWSPVAPLFFYKTASKFFAILFVLAAFLFSQNEARAAVPTATTGAATLVAATTATVNGTVDPSNKLTTVTFQYGTTTGYGTTVNATPNTIAAGAGATAVSAALTGLVCNTTYHFRVVAVNSFGTTNGLDGTFTTTACAPTATTNAATLVAATTATMNGTVASNGASTTVTFQYGLTTGYGSTATAAQSPVAAVPGSANSTAVSAAVTGLTCNTTYHFRVVAVNSVGTTNGLDGTFTTTACAPTAPTATTNAATSVTATGATLNGTVASNGASTTVTFEYGLTTGYGSTATAAQSPLPAVPGSATAVSAAVAGLTCNTLYHFRVVAVNSVGTTNGLDGTFTTTACAPTATTNAATSVAATTATMNGTVASNGASTTVTFEYGLTTGYGSTATAAQSPVAAVPGSANSTAVSAAVAGLTCNTLYHFRVVAVNSVGTTNGLDGTFTTTACAPTATTNAASGVTAWAATLNGTVSSNGADTTVSFEYGLTTAYGSSIAATPSLLAANAANIPVLAQVTGLNCNTTFHYRVVATNSAGTTNGLDGTFTTLACGAPYPATACAATRYGNDLGCTANDVSISSIALAPTTTRTSCVSGTPVILDLDLTVNFASPDRWDIGIFIANDGKLPTLLPVNGGASSCSVDILPITAPPFGYTFPDLDGVPQGTLDTCGDGNGAINGGLGWGIKRMTSVTLPCYASPTSGGQLFVPFVVSWDNQKSPTGSLCTSNLYPVPNTTSKCNAPASSVSVAVVVLPVITKTNGGTEINPGANTTYTVVINNNSGGTLQASFFKDPAVANLTVNSLSCAAAGGATCPIANNTVADMQGATGIPIPSANLPNNSSLTFTINATLSSGATVGSHLINTASVSIGSNSNSATDDDLIVNAPSAAKSFAPGTITEGAASVLTVTLTNPTASAVTGVVFIDTYPSGLVNTAAAGGATTCGGTVTAANDGNSLALSGGTIPASGSCTVTVNVTSATAGNYTNSTGTVTTNSVTISAASATLTVNVAVYGGFNACDSAAAPNAACTNTTTPATSHITTKISGSPFNLDIVALKTDGTRQTNYNNNVVVDLLDASNNSGALDAYNCRSTWTAIIATLTSTGFGANGLLTAGPFTVAEAYRDVRVRVTNSGGSTKKGCSTDNFAIRPNSLAVSATDADWQTAGTARALTNTNAAGGVVHKAGQPFTVTATAKNAANVTTANYAGTPALTVSACSGALPAFSACTPSLGILALGTTTSFVSGVLASNLATYSEVGAFNLTLQDTDFALVDAADTAATCAGHYVCSAATAVGRFVPDHFDTTAIAPMSCPASVTGTVDVVLGNATVTGAGTSFLTELSVGRGITIAGADYTVASIASATSLTLTKVYTGASANGLAISPCPSGGLVYSRQAFSATVKAKNAICPTPITCGDTINYDNTLGLAKAVTLSAVASDGGAAIATAAPGGTLSANTVAAAAFASGSSTVTVPAPVFSFAIEPTVPTDVYIRAEDADAVSSLRSPVTVSLEGGVKVVSGRLKIPNAYGSEKLSLTVRAAAQYYNGSSWVPSVTDNVTSLTLAASYNVVKNSVTTGTTTPAPTGVATLTGGLLSIVLGIPTGGATGNATINPTTPVYLPLLPGQATFGVYKGRNEFIYMRENY